MIKVTGLHKYFFRHKKNEIHVLNDMNIVFPDKGLVVLLGASGSGKTTLLNVIGGLDSVQTGSIVFDDVEIKGYQSAVWDKIRNESIGYIFQNYNLLPHLSVYDNIALVLKMAGIHEKEDIEQRVNYILQAVNMFPFRKKKATQLSGGQQQRVAIARALVKNPRVIIADEPTGNLDSKNTLEIMNIIKEISKQKLVVLVTHEKELARIYGDRIIEIKDGSVINDYDNDPTHEHNVSDDNVVYLKDMIETTSFAEEHVQFTFYQDTDTKLDPVKVRLIVLNKTLYLDVDSSIDKIKLVDQNSNLIIRDEHYIKKNKEELLETSFRTEYLENRGLKREYKTVVSMKQIFMLAFQKIVASSRKGKLMLFSFMMSGAVVAVMVAIAASSLIPDLSSRIFDHNYVYIDDSSNQMTYEELNSFLQDQDESYINTTQSAQIGIVDPIETQNNLLAVSSYLDLIDFAEGRMVIGRRPTADNEFVITLPLAEQIIEGSGAEYGIWTIRHLMYEKYRINGYDMTLTGIIRSDIRGAYTSRGAINLLNPVSLVIGGDTDIRIYSHLHLEGKTLLKGVMPTDDQIAISSALYVAYFGLSVDDAILPVNMAHLDNIEISGIFDSDQLAITGNDELVEKYRFNLNHRYYVYASDTKELIKDVKTQNVQNVYDVVEQMKLFFKEDMVELRVTTGVISGIVIGFALIGFYFVMHSSMVSRIYDIAVYRALGMKKSELMLSFLVEILIISTVTSLVGYLVSAYGLHLASDTLIGQFRLFIVTPLSVFLGVLILYGINVVGGMLPILLLLRKTPAQILSQYDI
ncbi:MAG TPA: ABC transporter ATP-binding protein/permease [Acholeplasmataceae bacterium]|nr:ABC transporter ATP-binding protein/permease [Acholeplasmataceae bacterium]